MAVVIPYTKQTWTDGVSSCSAARNNVHEDGLNDAHFQPCVRAFHSAAQSITTATNTALALNSERFDQAGNVASTMHDLVTNNSRLTCRHAGVYEIIGNIEWAANATGVRDVFIRLNNTTNIAYGRLPSLTAVTAQQEATTHYALAVNDFVELFVFQNSGGGLNVNATSAYSPEFSMVRVG